MQIINKDEFEIRKDEFLELIKQGAVFIYPTDTIYGIGCDATNQKAVRVIREIKAQSKRPFSVIAPSKEWIMANCECDSNPESNEWLDKLPGPYTLIFKMKKNNVVAKEVTLNIDTLGVRLPDHWFTKFAQETNTPIITTSANFTGEYFMTSMDDLNPKIKGQMDFIIYEGEKKGKASTIINLSDKEPEIRKR